MRLKLNDFMKEWEYVHLDLCNIYELDGMLADSPCFVPYHYRLDDRGVLTLPLYYGTPGLFETHRTMLLLLNYAEKTLNPIYSTPDIAPELCQSFNVQLSSRAGSPDKVSRRILKYSERYAVTSPLFGRLSFCSLIPTARWRASSSSGTARPSSFRS